MYYLEKVYKGGLADEIDRICGTTSNNYSNFDKVARINQALERYYFLAQQASRQWLFDDHDNTSPPIETQDIVSGTGRYKFTSFTSEVLDLLRVEILDSNAKGVSLIQETIDDLGVPSLGSTSGKLSYSTNDTFQARYLDTSNTGTPTHYCKFGDFIYLTPIPDYSETSGLKIYFGRMPTKYSFVTVTITEANPGVCTATAHGLSNQDSVIFETDGTLPTNITADTAVYYVINKATDTFQLCTTAGGSTAVNTSGSVMSGNHKFLKVNKEPGIPSIHHPYLARYAALQFLIEKNLRQANALSQMVQADEASITRFIASRGKDIRPHLSVRQENNR